MEESVTRLASISAVTLMLLCGSPAQAAPPAITQHPRDLTVAAGQFVTFSVATSASEATYQWQVSTNGYDFSTIPGATESTYTFKPVRVGETGTRYRVVVSKNGESAYSRPATLTITKAVSTVLVDELPKGRVYGQTVEIKALVIGTSGKPNGEIAFMDGNIRIGGPVSFDPSNGTSLTITTNELALASISSPRFIPATRTMTPASAVALPSISPRRTKASISTPFHLGRQLSVRRMM